jgi:hypothetical protein
MAAASLALGVADVVVTHQHYVKGPCTDAIAAGLVSIFKVCDVNNLVFTWIGSGIWASIPVIIFGIMCIHRGRSAMSSTWFEGFAFVSAFIFCPAMVVLSAIEVYKGANIYYWSPSIPLTQDDLIKAILPIIIAAIGFVMFIMCFIAITYQCCCTSKDLSQYGTMEAGRVTTMRPSSGSGVYGGVYSGGCGSCAASRPQVSQSPYSVGRPNSSAFQGSFFSPPAAQTGFSARPTTYNYFSNMNPSAFRSPAAPANPAYNFFSG